MSLRARKQIFRPSITLTMKKIFVLVALILPVLLKAQDSTKTILPEGTIVSVQLMQDINSGTANVGEVLTFETSEPITVGDKMLVDKGLKVTGKVIEAAPRKGLGKAGKLNFSIDYLYLPNGKVVKLTTELKANGKDKVGTAVAEAVLLTPLFLLKKGKDIKFEKGQIFKAFVEENTLL
jgi:hypothetical protein